MTSPRALAEALHAFLQLRPGLSARDLSGLLRSNGVSIDKSLINRVLYSNGDLFVSEGESPPIWRVRVTSSTAPVVVEPRPERRLVRARQVSLWPWQHEALTAWHSRGRRGIIEAVTGAGKTMLGLVATRQAVEQGARTLILVPTIELQDQWHARLTEHLPDADIGRLGGGYHDQLARHDAVIAVVNSARDTDFGVRGTGGLLIADECHRYGAARNAEALKEEFRHRLALTATVQRSDGGEQAWLEPYFGSVCFSLKYKRALAENVIAHFRVALIGVQLSPVEHEKYVRLSEDVRRLKNRLVLLGVTREPYGQFMKETSNLAGGPAVEGRREARGFLTAFSERRAILADTSAKRAALAVLGGAIAKADHTLVFTQTIAAAEQAAATLSSLGIRAETIHSEHDREERRDVLSRFRTEALPVLVAPQVLDEGIDVPEADLAVIVAASRTRRQMIQRMGRVLRKKADRRVARFAVLYAKDTSEDPYQPDALFPAHKEFLDEILEVADETRVFTIEESLSITAFLSPLFHAPARPSISSGRRPMNRHALF